VSERIRHAAINTVLVLAASLAPASAFAQVKVLISGGFSGPYERLVGEFERTTGLRVETGSGASQGNGPQTIAAQIERGVPVDVVIMSRQGLKPLMDAGRIAAGSDRDLARTPLALAVRAGAAKPSVRTVEEFKAVMLVAHGVAVPSSTSGIFIAKEVFPRLGLEGKVALRSTPRGSEATALVASGAVEFALMPVSEIVHAPGVELAGRLPEEIQLHQVFAAAVVATSSRRDDAQRLIAFLASKQAAPEIVKGGMEPLGNQ
jgi:molybdate transport system substrate-binding protein